MSNSFQEPFVLASLLFYELAESFVQKIACIFCTIAPRAFLAYGFWRRLVALTGGNYLQRSNRLQKVAGFRPAGPCTSFPTARFIISALGDDGPLVDVALFGSFVNELQRYRKSGWFGRL